MSIENRMALTNSILYGCVALLSLSSCASAAQKLHDRQIKLENFAVGVVKHLLDRNPATYRQSVASLMREELNDSTIDKLQSIDKLPEPGLEELKIVDDAQDQKATNAVETSNVKTLGSAQNGVVPIQVKGRVVNYRNGVKKSEEPFSIEVDCKLTEDMEGYPRAVAVRGLDNLQAMSIRTNDPKQLSGLRRQRRRS
jgi:hypothetical protein